MCDVLDIHALEFGGGLFGDCGFGDLLSAAVSSDPFHSTLTAWDT
jgi:hypothetical protein